MLNHCFSQQATEGLHSNTRPSGGDHGRLLENALGEQLHNCSHVDQTKRDGTGTTLAGTKKFDHVASNPRKCNDSNSRSSFVVPLTGKVPPVLASRAFRQVPVLCGGSHGRVQHAPVHPQRVQGHGRQGKLWLSLISNKAVRRFQPMSWL